MKSGAPHRIFEYDRDIICLPKVFFQEPDSNLVKIPCRNERREFLSKNGLIGKIHLVSSMSEEEIRTEIRSVFKKAMKDKADFEFSILQPAGGSSKCLTIPSLSESFKWTASAVAGKNSKTPIYILAEDDLQVIIIMNKATMFSQMNERHVYGYLTTC